MITKTFHSPFLRPKNAAAYLGISISTFWRWVQRGTLPKGVRLSPRCTIWKIEALDTFIKSKKEA